MSASPRALRSFQYEVFGRVQGVFFRKFTQEEAVKLGVVGWVMNTPAGSVKGEAQGEEEAMSQFYDFLSKRGSPASRIDRCEITDDKPISELSFSSFDVRR